MFTLDQVVPWGRSFAEYQRMFQLTHDDLGGTILGCGDGPASFNAEATLRAARIVSCDPIYQFTREQIASRIDDTYDRVIEETRQNAHEFVWSDDIPSPDALGRIRMRAMHTFLDDYEAGRAEGRYVDAALPHLPFAAAEFDLALSSHFLFLYSEQLGRDFHLAGLRELCRVAREVRVFPLLALGGTRSAFIQVCTDALAREGYEVRIEPVPYEFQRGGNEMMWIRR